MIFIKKIIYSGVIFGALVLLFSLTGTVSAFEYKLLGPIPFVGDQGASPKLPELIVGIYNMAIWIVGIASLFMLSVGGFYYMTSAGNTSTASTAKTIITDSLLGLFVALVAWGLLYIINPDLVINGVANPSLFQADMSATVSEGALSVGGAPTETAPAETVPTETAPEGGWEKAPTIQNGCPTDPKIICSACINCVDYTGTCNTNPCKMNATLAAKITTALSGKNARVTEAWPPTVFHASSCHKDGSCADVNLTEDKGDVEKVKELYDALKSAGTRPVYESTNCAPYTAAGVNCKYYPTMTSASFHVNP